jgi:hypothetical protein
MGMHDRYYGDKCVPIPTFRNLVCEALFRKPIPEKEEPMCVESYEHVASAEEE